MESEKPIHLKYTTTPLAALSAHRLKVEPPNPQPKLPTANCQLPTANCQLTTPSHNEIRWIPPQRPVRVIRWRGHDADVDPLRGQLGNHFPGVLNNPDFLGGIVHSMKQNFQGRLIRRRFRISKLVCSPSSQRAQVQIVAFRQPTCCPSSIASGHVAPR